MKIPICLLFLVSLLLWSSCAKEEVVESLYIEADLQPYFDSFVEEAADRGQNIDLESFRVQAFIENIPDADVAGQCAYSEDSPRTVRIDQQYWRTASHLQKEFVIFHELGHCILGRSHTDAENANGTCSSIMESGLGTCRTNYRLSTRTEYLNELFD